MKSEMLVFRFEMPSKAVSIHLLTGGTKDIRVEVRSGGNLVAMISDELDSGMIDQFDFCKRLELLYGILQTAIVLNPERDWHNPETLKKLVEVSKRRAIEHANLLTV